MAVANFEAILPVSADVNSNGNLSVAGVDLAELAKKYSTPLYVYDGATIQHQVSTLRSLFKKYYPGEAAIAYASKVYFSYQMARKLAALGVGLDVISQTELRLAQKAGFSADGVHLHGNNKSEAEIKAALIWGVQAIVIDSMEELRLVEALAEEMDQIARIWLRVTPGLGLHTHPHIQTSHSDSKFGLYIQNGEAAEAIQYALKSDCLHLTGLHMHLGSQIFEAEPYRIAIEMMCNLAAENNYIPEELSPGGGWGVRYTPEDAVNEVETWVQTVSGAIQEACVRHDWPYPKLVLEPGRWLAGRAGVAVYSIGMQKTTPNGIHIIAVDGGLADNPRVALYQARYSALVVEAPQGSPSEKVRVVGKFCESGDVLIQEAHLPPAVRGQHLAIPVSGAYQLSMSSNYNCASRPAVLWLEDGRVEILQPREDLDSSPWLVYEP